MDEERGITAMMRTTGYSLAITGLMQARGEIAPGCAHPGRVHPAGTLPAELATRGIVVRQVAGRPG